MYLQVEKEYPVEPFNVIMIIKGFSYNSSLAKYNLEFTYTVFLDSTEEIPDKLKSIFDKRPQVYNISGTIITKGKAAKFNAYKD